MGKCHCGAKDCWDEHDYSWVSSESGWHGDINGCPSSVFFIHGKKIREQRQVPYGRFLLNDLPKLFECWGMGLPNARLVWTEDTGGGDCGLWIEGERDPTVDDLKRLEETRKRAREKAIRDLRHIHRQYPDLPFEEWNGEWVNG